MSQNSIIAAAIIVFGSFFLLWVIKRISPEPVINQEQKTTKRKEIPMTNRHKETRYVVTVPLKSVGISLILTLLFGPIGMFYSTIWGGLIMTPICFALGFLLGQVGFMLIWPICIIWGALAVSGSNKRIFAKAAID